ncbi:hypothetical protein HK100_006292 [Physocladia obscura]|uniref:HMG box domain-containing protein n=1 Tax=Physocladia obscura TaxID=109957 RepID=A0AAD5T615_9FUNG|nr:hypothetical protein HK100_006292 [Physocladia obscura]
MSLCPHKLFQVVAANERKAAQEDAKNAAAQAKKEADEAAEWNKGAKANKKEDEERKKVEVAAKKAERDAILAAEETAFAKKKPTNATKSKAPATTSLASMAQKMALGLSGGDSSDNAGTPIESYAASGIDAALDLLELTTKKSPNASQAVEKHPERRMKSAWAQFEEREMPILKAENPTLRLSQLKQLLQKKWKKSPDNPMNGELVGAYDMTADEARETAAAKKEEALDKMRVK